MAVGAEAVHPDDCGVRGRVGGSSSTVSRRSALTRPCGLAALGSSWLSIMRAIDDCGTAPICASTTLPSRNTSSVGIERTPKAFATSGLSSMLSLATLARPA